MRKRDKYDVVVERKKRKYTTLFLKAPPTDSLSVLSLNVSVRPLTITTANSLTMVLVEWKTCD